MKWDIRGDGREVGISFDPAMIARVERDGIESLTPVISRISSVVSIWPLVGLQAPPSENQLLSKL